MARARRAVFLDRDGTLMEDVGYPGDPEQVRLLPGVTSALAALKGRGFALVIISNQSGVGRGIITRAQMEAVHQRVLALLGDSGVEVDGAYYCPHAPDDGCECRKPRPGLLLRAAEDLGVDLANSFMVGDKPTDAEAGRRAGCRTILLGGQAGDGSADAVAGCWDEVVRTVVGSAKDVNG